MNNTEFYNITLEQFCSCFPEAETISMNDDFFVMDVRFQERNSPLMHP